MSRSNPNQNNPNPAVRFFEWNGEHGTIRYYDKDAKRNVDVTLPFTFLLLDELASVRGWHDASNSGIYSNEVRDTRTDVMVVKAFKGGTLAEGLYKEFKDRVATMGGQFNANCYIAFKHDGKLVIGSLKFKGATLNAWMEFRKANRNALYQSAVNITGFVEGKKGKVVYRVPTFDLKPVSADTDAAAVALDKQLQSWLESYLSRRTEDKAEPQHELPPPDDDDFGNMAPSEDDIPF